MELKVRRTKLSFLRFLLSDNPSLRPVQKTLSLLFFVSTLTACNWFDNGSSTSTFPLTLLGNVDIRQVSLAFDASGRIIELSVEEGDQVTQGQQLGRLDTSALELQMKQALAELRVQQQKLLSLKNGARPEEIEQAKSRLEAARSDTLNLTKELDRLVSVAESTQGRAVSESQIDAARTRLNVSRSNVIALQSALHLLELGPRQEDIAAAQATLDSLEARVDLLKLYIQKGTLLSPVAARVRARSLEVGDMANPNKPVFALALTHPKYVRVYVDEPLIGLIKPGMKANVISDSQPQITISGQVGFISSVAEFTPKFVQSQELRTHLVYEVRVVVEDSENQLRMGQPVTVTLHNANEQP